MSVPVPTDPARFAQAVRSLLGLIHSPAGEPLELVKELNRHLAAIYAAALALEYVEPTSSELCDDPDSDVNLRTVPTRWASVFGPKDLYWELYDPLTEEPEEAVAGSPASELGEIAHDLAEGMACWDAGRQADAVWTWKEGLESHWGRHAVSLIRVLHLLAFDHGVPNRGDGVTSN